MDDPAGICVVCGALGSSGVYSRDAAADQLAEIAAENDALAAEVDRLRRELNELRETQPQHPANAIVAKRGVHQNPRGIELDIMTEGDGVWARRPVAAWTPHGNANVLAVAHMWQHGSDEMLVVSGGADKRVCVSVVTASTTASAGGPPYVGSVVASVTLTAPVLAVAPRPQRRSSGHGATSGHIAAALMDGRVVLLFWDAPSLTSCRLIVCEPPLVLHSKYVARVAWSPTGNLCATASADASCALFAVEHDSGEQQDLRLRKLQRLHFGGAIDAIAWAELPPLPSQDVGRCGCATLVLSVRGAPTLYYISVIMTEPSSGCTAPGHRLCDGLVLPVLIDLAAKCDDHPRGAKDACQVRSDYHLVMHRLPLSEDGGGACIYSGASSSDDSGPAHVMRDPSVLLRPRVGEFSHGSVDNIATGASNLAPAAVAVVDTGCSATAADGDASASAAEATVRSDATDGGWYLPVGFNIVDLAVAPSEDEGDHGFEPGSYRRGAWAPPLLAAAADNGIVYVCPFGTSTNSKSAGGLQRRLAGHNVASAISASTRIAWAPGPAAAGTASASYSGAPHYIVATSEKDFAAVVYSVGAASCVQRISAGHQAPAQTVSWRARATNALAPVGDNASVAAETTSTAVPLALMGHSAAIKDAAYARRLLPSLPLCHLPGNVGSAASTNNVRRPAHVLATCGCDKRVILWAE